MRSIVQDYMRTAMELLIYLPEKKLPNVVDYLETLSSETYDTISVGEDIKMALKEVEVMEAGKKKRRSAREFLNEL